MGFNRIEFFYAIFFLLIPVVIHLLNFVKTKKIFFSRILFFKELKESNNKVQRVKYWFILASRIFCFLFLILAVAGLFFKNENINSNRFTAYFIDNSLSIDGIQSEGLSRILKYVSNDVASFENVCLNTNDQSRKGLYFLSKSQFIDELTTVELNSNAFNFNDVISRYSHIKDLSKIDSGVCRVVVLSDFQKNGITVREQNLNNWTFIKVGGNDERVNIVLDSVWIESPLVKKGSLVKLKVKYSSSGGSVVEPIFCKLFLDSIQISNTSIENKSGIVEFVFSLKEAKKYVGKIMVNDKVLFDNEYYLTIDATPKINVSVISNNGINSHIYRVYSNEEAFDVKIYEPNNFSSDEILKSNIIIFDQILGNESLVRLASEGANNKKTIVYVPSIALSNEDDLLLSFVKEKINGITILKDTSFYKLRTPRNELFFEGVFDKIVQSFDFTSAKRSIRLKKGEGKSIIEFENGEPYLIEKEKMFVFSSSLSKDESGLQFHPLFVPLMYRMAMISTPTNRKISFMKNDFIQFGEGFKTTDVVSLKNDVENIRLDFSLGKNGELLFNAKEYDLQQGIYNVVKNDSVVSNLAINLDKAESEMEFYAKTEIQKMFPKSTVLELNNHEDLDVLVNEKNEGVSLWKYCLTLSLLFLFIEIILINQLK